MAINIRPMDGRHGQEICHQHVFWRHGSCSAVVALSVRAWAFWPYGLTTSAGGRGFDPREERSIYTSNRSADFRAGWLAGSWGGCLCVPPPFPSPYIKIHSHVLSEMSKVSLFSLRKNKHASVSYHNNREANRKLSNSHWPQCPGSFLPCGSQDSFRDEEFKIFITIIITVDIIIIIIVTITRSNTVRQ